MATQFHVAHSGLVKGAGVVAGAPYYCSEGSIRNSLGRCMKADEQIPTCRAPRARRAGSRSTARSIRSPASPNDRVWIFRGAPIRSCASPWRTRWRPTTSALVNPANSRPRRARSAAGHTFPTRAPTRSRCDASEPPFVGNCGLRRRTRAARAPVRQARRRAARRGRTACASSTRGLTRQRPAAPASPSEAGFSCPQSCRRRRRDACRLHVVFHGCKQGASFVGDQFVLGVAAISRPRRATASCCCSRRSSRASSR